MEESNLQTKNPHLTQRIRPNHIFATLVLGGIVFAASFHFISSSNQPLFTNLDQFVFVAGEEIKIEQGTQISGGDIGSNKILDIVKDVIVNGNLFADTITIDKNTQINGNASFNKLQIKKEAQILGSTTTPTSLPIVILPDIPDFQVGTQDFLFVGEINTLPAGRYRVITLEKSGRLVLSGGTYNLRKLELKDNSTLIFNASTTLNIQFKLRGRNRVSILPGLNTKPDDLRINYRGIISKKEKESREDDDDEATSLLDDQEKKDHKAGKMGRPVIFGKNSFLNFKLLAPKAIVKLGEASTLRGQVFARKVRVGKDSVLSRELTGIKIAQQKEIVADPEGGVYPINILLVSLTPEATFEDAMKVAQSINGRIVGLVSSVNLYQVETQTTTIAGLENLITLLRTRTDLKIEGVFRDYLLPIDI